MKHTGPDKEKRMEPSLAALAFAALLLVAIFLQAAMAGAAENAVSRPAADAVTAPVARDASLLIGSEQELIRRAEGRLQRSVMDRLLGPGKGEVALEPVPEEEAAAKLESRLGLGTEAAPGRGLPVSVVVRIEESFAPERLDLVRSEIREALRGYPFRLGQVIFRLQDGYEQAVSDAQRAVYEGAYDTALERTLEALKLKPDRVEALELLGSVYLLLDDGKKARQTWERVMKLDPQNRHVPVFLARLN